MIPFNEPGTGPDYAALQDDGSPLSTGCIHLHGCEFSLSLVTPDILFEPLQRVVQKVLLAFDVVAASSEPPRDLLQLVASEVAQEIEGITILTSPRLVASVFWLWLHTLLRSEAHWKAALEDIQGSDSLPPTERLRREKELSEDLRALRAIACFAYDTLRMLQNAVNPPTYGDAQMFKQVEQYLARSPPSYCGCSAHSGHAPALAPPSYDEAQEAELGTCMHIEYSSDDESSAPSQQLAGMTIGEALSGFKIHLASVTKKRMSHLLRPGSCDSLRSICSREGVPCSPTRTSQAACKPQPGLSLYPSSGHPAGHDHLLSAPARTPQDAEFAAWLLQPPPKTFTIGHVVERMHWTLSSPDNFVAL